MKTPKSTTDGRDAKAGQTAGPDIRRIPAHVGVIDHAEVPEGRPAQAGQPGEIRPVESALVGEGPGPDAAARRTTAPEAAPSVTASDSPKTAPAKSEPAPRRGGFLPLVLGGAVAAGLGAAAAIYALPHLPANWQPQGSAAVPAEPAEDRDALIQAAADAGRQAALADLTPRIEALEQDQAPAEDLTPRIEALEQAQGQDETDMLEALRSQLEEQSAQLQDQAARLEELAARPAFDPEAAGALQDQIEAAAAEAEQRLEAARAEAQELQDAAAESTRRAQAVAAIAQLQAALDQGVTPDQARQTLEGAGLATPEALQGEVPSLAQLQADYPEAARAALRASFQDSSATGEGNLVTNFLRAQTGARSIAPREGDDTDAVLSRADADVQAGRITDAVTQLQTLPEPARATGPMAEWLTGAEAYTQARAALTDLSSETN